MARAQSIAYFFWLTLLTSALSAEWETLEGCRLLPSSKNDGDSFVVAHQDQTYTFRLYFVDAPETVLFYPERVQDQAAYFESDMDQMVRLGHDTAEFARRFLARPFTVHTRWSDAMGHHKRYAALLYNDQKESLIEALVAQGYVRIKGFQPPSAWPGGKDASDYHRLLTKLERQAQQSRQGAWRTWRREDDRTALSFFAETEANRDGLIDVNSAREDELRQLPGIGPVYAKRLVESRPFFHLDDLVKVHGIGPLTLERLKPLVTLSLPAAYADTARSYLLDPNQWANRQIQLRVKGLHALDLEAPEGFDVFTAATGSPEVEGGALRLYLPKEQTEEAQNYFERSQQPATLSVYFFRYEKEWVAVLRRN
ncbi:MAG: helix-hairpin-helix domain-containing protein [Verrucomicrobiota bacterium]